MRRLTDFLGAHPFDRDIARRPFLQQQFRRSHDRISMKARPHGPTVKSVRYRDQAHSLMVRHIGSHDGNRFTFRNATRRVVQGFIPAVAAACARPGQTAEIPHSGGRVDHRCKRSCIG